MSEIITDERVLQLLDYAGVEMELVSAFRDFAAEDSDEDGAAADTEGNREKATLPGGVMLTAWLLR